MEPEVPDEWTNHVNYMDFIPDELVLKIMFCMTPNQRLVLQRVNRRLRRLAVSLVHDFSLLSSLNHLTGHNRCTAIMKYSNLKKLDINNSDVTIESFPIKLALSCPLIEEFRITTLSGLLFILSYINSLPHRSSCLTRLVLEMRFDTSGAIGIVAEIYRSCPYFREIIFNYPTRNTSEDLMICQQKLLVYGIRKNQVSLSICPSAENDKDKVLDDNDFFWDLYQNVGWQNRVNNLSQTNHLLWTWWMEISGVRRWFRPVRRTCDTSYRKRLRFREVRCLGKHHTKFAYFMDLSSFPCVQR